MSSTNDAIKGGALLLAAGLCAGVAGAHPNHEHTDVPDEPAAAATSSIPRFWKGEPDASWQRGRGGVGHPGAGEDRGRRGERPHRGERPRGPRSR